MSFYNKKFQKQQPSQREMKLQVRNFFFKTAAYSNSKVDFLRFDKLYNPQLNLFILEDYFEFLTDGGNDNDIPKEAQLKDANNTVEEIESNNEETDGGDDEMGSTESIIPNEDEPEPLGNN